VREVRIQTTLTPRDVARVSRVLVLRNPMSILLMSAGPVCLAIGLASGSGPYTRFGLTMVWLVLLVPAFAWLAGTFNAYRPGARDIYEPAEWTFGEAGIGIRQPGREARADWSEFPKWRSAGQCLLLHTSHTRYVVIPWRDVPAAGREELEELLTGSIGKRKR
jgi:hypothetical protein